MVVFDASILLFILDDNVKSSAPEAKQRVEYLIDNLSKVSETIIIPTPALSGSVWFMQVRQARST